MLNYDLNNQSNNILQKLEDECSTTIKLEHAACLEIQKETTVKTNLGWALSPQLSRSQK